MTACHGCGDDSRPVEPFSQLCIDCLAEQARRAGVLPSQRAAVVRDVKQLQTGERE